MITFIRTASTNPGKQAKALAWAREVAAFVKATNGTEVHVSVPVGGNPNRIRLTAQHENLGTMETSAAKLTSLPKWQEMQANGADLFVSESNFTEIWRDV